MKKFVLFLIILFGVGTYFVCGYIQEKKDEENNRDTFYAAVTDFDNDTIKVTVIDEDKKVIYIDNKKCTFSIIGSDVVYNKDFSGSYTLKISSSTKFTWMDATMSRSEIEKGSVIEVACKKESVNSAYVIEDVYEISLIED